MHMATVIHACAHEATCECVLITQSLKQLMWPGRGYILAFWLVYNNSVTILLKR